MASARSIPGRSFGEDPRRGDVEARLRLVLRAERRPRSLGAQPQGGALVDERALVPGVKSGPAK